MLVGPILYLELLLGSRRGRFAIFQYVYAGWLVLQFGVLYLTYLARASSQQWLMGAPTIDFNATFEFASGYGELFVVQQFLLLLLAAPALAAGAITDEKERGTLQYLFSAGLTSWEIIVGKLLGRLCLLGKIFVTGLPFLFFIAAFAGLSGAMLLTVILQSVVVAFGIGSASMLASVWAKHTRDAVLSLYAVLVVLLLAGAAIARFSAAGLTGPLATLADLVACLDPLHVLKPGWTGDDTATMRQRLLVFLAGWAGFGLLCLAVAAWRMRPAYVKQMQGAGKLKQKLIHYFRPEVAGEPVRWKERHVTGMAPLPWMKLIPRWLILAIIFLSSAGAVLAILAETMTLPDLDLHGLWLGIQSMDRTLALGWLAGLGAAAAVIASLLVGIRCSGAITGERERNTWEALLLTPMETPQLVRAKLWGVIGATYVYLIAFFIPLAVLTAFITLGGNVGGVIVLAVSIAATWMAMFYVGASGLWCSARSRTSWRSLIGMFFWTYVAGAIPYMILFMMSWMMYVMLALMYLTLVSFLFQGSAPGGLPISFAGFFVVLCITLGFAFLFASWFFLKEAEKRVADYDRTRHWRSEVIRRPRIKPKQVQELEAAEQAKEY